MKYLMIFLVLTSLILVHAEKQITLKRFNIYSGINSSFEAFTNESSDFLENYWKPGINIGISFDIKLLNYLNLIPTYELNYYQFSTYDYEAKIPEIYLKSYQGEKSLIHRYLLDFQFIPPEIPFINPFLTTGIGYVYEDIGKIHIHQGYMGNGEREYDLTFGEKNYFIHSVGIGMNISIFGNWIIHSQTWNICFF